MFVLARVEYTFSEVRLLTDLRWTLLFALVQRDKLIIIATTTGVVEGHAFIIVPGKVPTGQLTITSASVHWQCAACCC